MDLVKTNDVPVQFKHSYHQMKLHVELVLLLMIYLY